MRDENYRSKKQNRLLPGVVSLLVLGTPCCFADELSNTETADPTDPTASPPMSLPSSGPFRLETKFYDVLAPLQYSKLEGKTDQQKFDIGTNKIDAGTSSNLLRGYLQSDQGESTLTTLQRKPLARFQNNLQMMQARLDPNIDGQFAVQLARSRTYVDFLRAQMKAELDKARPLTAIPDITSELNKAKAPLNLNTSKVSEEIERERRKATLILEKQRKTVTAVTTLPVPDDFQIPGKTASSSYRYPEEFYYGKGLPMSDFAGFDFQLQSPATNTGKRAQAQLLRQFEYETSSSRQVIETEREKMRRQMEADLRSNPQGNSPYYDKQMQGELARAQRLQSQEARRVRGELDAIMTAIRPNPGSDQEVIGTIGAGPGKIISWDQWYANFTRAYEPLLIRAFRKYKDPAGSNTVSITVWPNHQLKVSVHQKELAKYDTFDRASVEAYSALNGNASLQFPIGSRRKQITFLIDNKHASGNPINGVESLPFSGDKELLQTR